MDKWREADRVREVSPAYGSKAGGLTIEDFFRIPGETRLELVEGELRVPPAPTVRHQRAVGNLFEHLMAWAGKAGSGEVFPGPLDVVLSDNTVLQPDILFISRERQSIVTSQRVEGAPDLVVEVISLGTGDYDRVTKRQLYAKAGVKEYWLVDPDAQQVLVIRLGQEASTSQDASTSQGASTSTELFPGTSVLKSTLLDGFEVKLTEVFRA